MEMKMILAVIIIGGNIMDIKKCTVTILMMTRACDNLLVVIII